MIAALAFVACLPPVVGAETAWSRQPSFTAPPAALVNASRAQKPVEGMPVVELLEETRIAFDKEGRRETRFRYVFRVDHESGVEGWRTIGSIWKPWYQARPTLKARVITPDGAEHLLDPATIGESPVHEDARVFDDRKRLAAPLPQLCVGAIAEVEVITREVTPAFDSGALVSIWLRQNVTVLESRVTVETPEGMPLTWKVVGMPGVSPTRTTRQGLSILALELGRVDPTEDSEPHEPAEAHPRPTLLISTVPSWAVVAQAYQRTVERQLAGADLAERAKAAMGDARDTRQRINRILERMNREIKYTGLEFGAASVVPRTPAEVLTRGYGDCKDKATLLVGLLRAAGIQAHVALLSTDPGPDLEDEVPGLNHFDHAIVFVPGTDPIWIDPTAELYRAGELPFQDQGRKALIAGPGTTTLARIPALESRDNRAREIREVFLADSGPSRVTELSCPDGLGEGLLRAELSNTEPKQLRENLKKYVLGVYEAKDLGAVDMPDPMDLSKPFSLKLEALDSKVGTTYDFEATVTINLWNMTEKFRRYVPLPSDKEAANPKSIRKHALQFQDPHTVEWEYRIHPPAGFASRTLPAADVVAFGPASLSRQYELRPDGSVLARFRFDSGKARWSAEECETAKQALVTFGKSAPISLGFDLTAEAHLTAGRIKESIQAYRDFAASRPGKGAPLSKMAMATLKGGMGELAREQARKACKLEPESAYAQRTLGYILLHDLVGRPFRKGWDRAGALKAMREAKRLDPADKLARRNLAIVLEYNAAGDRYGPGSQLDLAIEEYQVLRKELKADDVDVNLMVCLGRASRFKELEELAKSLPPSSTRSAWLLAAIALNRGVEQALAEAPSVVPDAGPRRSALLSAGDILIPLRRYQEASGILAAGAVGANDASAIRSRAAILGKTHRVGDTPFDAKEPSSVAWSLLKALLLDEKDGKELAGYFSPAFWSLVSRDAEHASFQRPLKESMAGLSRSGLSPQVAFDVAYALCQVGVEGDDAKGFKLRFRLPGEKDLIFYLSRIGGKYVIAALENEFPMFGLEVIRRLDAGDAAGARVWLDWVRDQAWAGNSEDPLSGSMICRFWTKGQDATPEVMRLAGNVLQITEKACTQVPATLLEARASASTSAATPAITPAITSAITSARQLDLDLCLSYAYWNREDAVRMEPIARRLLAAQPASKVAARHLTWALDRQKKWDLLLQHSEEMLKLRPDDLTAFGVKAHALSGLGRAEEKERLLRSLVDRGLATASEFNNLAWGNLMTGKSDDQTLEFARRSILLQPQGNAGSLHTLASILAERGDVTEALEVMAKMLQETNRDEPRGEDWYVFARIAEQFGERDLALARYRKVAAPAPGELEADSCHLLAQRRIGVLSK